MEKYKSFHMYHHKNKYIHLNKGNHMNIHSFSKGIHMNHDKMNQDVSNIHIYRQQTKILNCIEYILQLKLQSKLHNLLHKLHSFLY